MTWERLFIRLQVALIALVALSGVALGPERLVQLMLHAGPPLAGEVVPRQIPYRGYLERNGIPVTDPAVPLTFTVRYVDADGGMNAWSETRGVPVSSGQFSVDLGDVVDAGIPADVFRQPFAELSVAVGGMQLSGSQRILTVPYAASAGRASAADGPLAGELAQMRAVDFALQQSLATENEIEVYGTDAAPATLGLVDNQIVRFLNVSRSVGTAITRTSSVDNGDTFTINEPGVYSIAASIVGPPNGQMELGLSLNATPLERQSDILGLPLNHKLTATFASAPPGYRQYPTVSGVYRLRSGDQVRVHVGLGYAAENAQGVFTWARVTKLFHAP